jgi:hypothetical protein
MVIVECFLLGRIEEGQDLGSQVVSDASDLIIDRSFQSPSEALWKFIAKIFLISRQCFGSIGVGLIVVLVTDWFEILTHSRLGTLF